jgi:hypothetical protein
MIPMVAMRIGLGTLAAMVAGCSTPPPLRSAVDPAQSPEQIVRTLSNRKLTSRGTSSDGFGLEAFRPFLRPIELRCQTDGGQLVAVAPIGVVFTFRDANNSSHEARVYMPQKLACRSSAGTLWGVEARYNEATFFPSSWADATFYYATIPLTYASGAAFDRSDPNSQTNLAARTKEADECQSSREQYAQQLRTDPRVGMKVQFGVITDIRLPLVQVQYDEAGRRLKGREQEWVQASSLSAGSNCPQ